MTLKSNRRLQSLGLLLFCIFYQGHIFAFTEEHWISPQMNGMGSVGLLSDDVIDRFFSDPARSADRLKGPQFRFFDVGLSASKDMLDTVATLQKAVTGKDNANNGSAVVSYLDSFRALFGKQLYSRFQINTMALAVRAFTVVPYSVTTINGSLDVPSWPSAQLTADSFVGLGLGWGYQPSKIVSLGANIRPGVRTHAMVKGSTSDIGGFADASTSSEAFKPAVGSGYYVPLDLGAGLSLPGDSRINAVWKNVGGARAVKVLKGDIPPDYDNRLSLGVSKAFIAKGMHRLAFASELQDILKISESFWLRMQFGGQYQYKLPFQNKTLFSLNVGLQSGYPSVGVALDLFLFKLEIARHTRESGLVAGNKPTTIFSGRVYSQIAF